MNWLDKLERKFGRYAIHNLMLYIVILYGVGFVLDRLDPMFYYTWLSLNPVAILHGQVWRLVTFIILPPSDSLLWIFISLYMCYLIGSRIEAVWGAFRFNIYFFSGVMLNVLAGFITYFITGSVSYSQGIGTTFISASMFLIFASLFPETQFLLFFIIPVKVKWFAIAEAALYGLSVLTAFLPGYRTSESMANAIAIIISLLNFLIYFLSSKHMIRFNPHEIKRKSDFKKKIKQAQRMKNIYPGGARHKCAVCGRTEIDNPNLEFRFCSKCKGNYEYCQEHLFTHKHVE